MITIRKTPCPNTTIQVDGVNKGEVTAGSTLNVTANAIILDSTLTANTLSLDIETPSLEPFPYVGLNNLLDPNNDFCWAAGLTQAQSVVGFQPWNLFNSVGFDATNKMWTLNGVDQYLQSDNSLLWTDKRNALSFHIFVNSGLTGSTNQPFILSSSSSSSTGQFYVFRGGEPTENNLIFRHWNSGGSLVNTVFTDFFLGFNDVNMMVSVVVDYDTGEAHAYRNGVFFATAAHDAIKPVTAIAQRIGRVGGAYGEFKFGVHGMYNDLHNATQVMRFFNEFKNDYGL